MSIPKSVLVLIISVLLSLQSINTQARPKIGLVLGGGGAKGAAHVGVLKYLEQHNIPIDIAVGTSAGSAVAALYAMGQSAEEINNTFLSTEWEKGYIDSTPRPDLSIRRKQDQRQFAIDFDFGYGDGRFLIPKGIVQGQRLQILLNEMTLAAATISDFDQLPLRYRAVATDLETGKEVVLSKGNLAKAIRASMAVPGVFTPVVIDEKTLVDGGLANNLPISVARNLGADIVIAVDLATPLRTSKDIDTSLDVLGQLSDFMTGSNTEIQRRSLMPDDIYIRPEFGDIGSASFDRVEETMELGFKAAKLQEASLSALSVDLATYQHYEKKKRSHFVETPVIKQIKLVNQSNLNDDIIMARIEQQTGQALNPGQLERDLGLIYGLGYFQSITYLLETEADNSTTLVINAKSKSWGPNFIRFGIEMEDNFKGTSAYGISASLLTTGINKFGAEWVNTVELGSSPSFYSEFYQPLNFDGDIFTRSYVSLDRFEAPVYEQGLHTATYEVREHKLGLEFGKQLGTYADVAFGLMNGGGKAQVLIGDPSLPEIKFDSGAYYIRAFYDRLNDQFFPSDGHYFQTEYRMNRRELGAHQNNDRVYMEALYATQMNDWRLNIGARGSFLTKLEGGIEDDFRLGGLFNLSGYETDELSGDQGLLLAARLFKRMNTSLEWYIGGSFEAGTVYAKGDTLKAENVETAGNIFVAANTFLGPIILAYGYADENEQAVYLSIGNTF